MGLGARSSRRVRGGGVVTAALIAVVFGGCGGGVDAGDGASAPPALTKQQLVRKLGDICQEHTDWQVVAIERFEKKHGIPIGKPTPSELEEELVKVILPIVRDTVHDVGVLRPPASERREFRRFVRALEHGIEASERDPSWIAGGGGEPFMKARETSAALGAYYCGQA